MKKIIIILLVLTIFLTGCNTSPTIIKKTDKNNQPIQTDLINTTPKVLPIATSTPTPIEIPKRATGSKEELIGTKLYDLYKIGYEHQQTFLNKDGVYEISLIYPAPEEIYNEVKLLEGKTIEEIKKDYNINIIAKIEEEIKYYAYIDDLFISFDTNENEEKLIEIIKECNSEKVKINKTTLLDYKNITNNEKILKLKLVKINDLKCFVKLLSTKESVSAGLNPTVGEILDEFTFEKYNR